MESGEGLRLVGILPRMEADEHVAVARAIMDALRTEDAGAERPYRRALAAIDEDASR